MPRAAWLCSGNLAPDGAVVKQSAVAESMMVHSGQRIFESEGSCAEHYAGKVQKGDVVVIRNETQGRQACGR